MHESIERWNRIEMKKYLRIKKRSLLLLSNGMWDNWPWSMQNGHITIRIICMLFSVFNLRLICHRCDSFLCYCCSRSTLISHFNECAEINCNKNQLNQQKFICATSEIVSGNIESLLCINCNAIGTHTHTHNMFIKSTIKLYAIWLMS